MMFLLSKTVNCSGFLDAATKQLWVEFPALFLHLCWVKKIPLIAAQCVLFLALLSGFGWVVKNRLMEGHDYGWMNGWIEGMAGFPDLFRASVKEVKALPQTFVSTPKGFENVNRLPFDVWALSPYSNDEQGRNIDLWNLRTREVRHRWKIDKNVIPLESHWRVHNPLLMADSSVVAFVTNRSPLFRLNKNSELLWRQDSLSFHHSINLDADGMIWACVQQWERGGRHIGYRGRYTMGGKTVNFLDNSIAQIEPNSGHIRSVTSCLDILKNNGLEHLILRSGDAQDPMHLNDIEPALYSGEFFETGDLFLSFRNLQAVLHYRPRTGEVLRVIDGPLAAQHDVDIVDDHTLAIFNNAVHENSGVYTSSAHKYPVSKDQVELKRWYSRIECYDFETEAFRPLWEETMAQEDIITFSEGLQEFLPDGSAFIEEQNSGILWVISDEGVLYKDVLYSHHEGHHHLPNWTRIIPSTP